MSWFKKLFTVTTNSVNEKMENITESLVDIKREGNALVSQLNKDINTLHTRIVEAQKEIQLSKHEHKNHVKLVGKYEEMARRAVLNGNDQDAMTALERVEGVQMIADTHQQTINILQPIVDQQIIHLNKMTSEKQSLKAEIIRLDIEEKQYKLREKLSGGSGAVSGGIDLNYLRQRVNNARATCEAKEIVSTQVFQEPTTNIDTNTVDLQEKLNALKAEVLK